MVQQPSSTAPKPRAVRIPGADWKDFQYAARAAGSDRNDVIRQYVAWYLRHRNAALPERPDLESWAAQAAADTKTLGENPRSLLLGEDWRSMESATAAAGTERGTVIAGFVAWYLHRPGAASPSRPSLESWAGTAIRRDDPHDLHFAAAAVGLTEKQLLDTFTAWFLRRPGAAAVERPAAAEWEQEAQESAERIRQETAARRR